jgi:triosephosphate isomerase
MMRKPLMAANWKMYKTSAETQAFFEAFRPMITDAANAAPCDIVICPPFPSLGVAVEAARGSGIGIGAQNLYWGKEGAFTGEISGNMLQAAGCTWVIVGHSERRQYFGETEPGVLRKTRAALEFGLTPIVCMGERLEDRESNHTESVLAGQFDGGVAPLAPEEFAKVVIAYEPVWAIGTGKTATPAMAADAHRFIRSAVGLKFGDGQAAATRILYGGSVKPDNVKSLMAEEDIDGALVGGASLDPQSFAAIVRC